MVHMVGFTIEIYYDGPVNVKGIGAVGGCVGK